MIDVRPSQSRGTGGISSKTAAIPELRFSQPSSNLVYGPPLFLRFFWPLVKSHIMISCRLSFYGATWAIICKLGFICNDWTYSYFRIMSTQGQNFGWNRSGCDNTFKQDMYILCDKKYGRKKRWISLLASNIKRCKFFADLYYKSVLIFGRFYWSNPSEHWCKRCTKDLGDPFKPLRH